ncbi:hypothetical protein GCM10027271_46870 [Saccharopolyspora gloriosae]
MPVSTDRTVPEIERERSRPPRENPPVIGSAAPSPIEDQRWAFRQSRSRIRPSRRRVFTVDAGAVRRCAASR